MWTNLCVGLRKFEEGLIVKAWCVCVCVRERAGGICFKHSKFEGFKSLTNCLQVAWVLGELLGCFYVVARLLRVVAKVVSM